LRNFFEIKTATLFTFPAQISPHAEKVWHGFYSTHCFLQVAFSWTSSRIP